MIKRTLEIELVLKINVSLSGHFEKWNNEAEPEKMNCIKREDVSELLKLNFCENGCFALKPFQTKCATKRTVLL